MKLIYETCENGFNLRWTWIKKRPRERYYTLSSVKIPGPVKREKIYMDYGTYASTFIGYVSGRSVGSVGRDIDTSKTWTHAEGATLGCWIDAEMYKQAYTMHYTANITDFSSIEYRVATQAYNDNIWRVK
jgi:hypothetical protein